MRKNDVIVGYVGWRQYQQTTDSGVRVLNLFELSWDGATEVLQKAILGLDERCKKGSVANRNRYHLSPTRMALT